MRHKRNRIGYDGFIWWLGICEDRNDPLMLNRIRVRVYGTHSDDRKLVSANTLPWAQPILPCNWSDTSHNVKEGDMVMGFWVDGQTCQVPYYFGKFQDFPAELLAKTKGFSDPGENLSERPVRVSKRELSDDGTGIKITNASPQRYPDRVKEQTTSRLARNENIANTVIQFRKDNLVTVNSVNDTIWTEPSTKYGANYPYDKVTETESEHIFELDDTKGKERIMLTHRSGTSIEMLPTGSVIHKTTRHKYNIVHGTQRSNFRGNLETTTERATKYRSKGKTIIEINSDCELHVAGTLTLHGQGGVVLNSDSYVRISGRSGVIIETLSGVAILASSLVAPKHSDTRSPSFAAVRQVSGSSKSESEVDEDGYPTDI